MELTKSAKKSLAILYKEYRQRIKRGERRPDAATICWGVYPPEVLDDARELCEVGAIRMDFSKTIWLDSKAVIYMEGLTADTLKEWLSFGLQLIP